MESAILHNICLSFSVVYKCRRIPSYDLKYTLTSLSSKVDREYRLSKVIKTLPSSKKKVSRSVNVLGRPNSARSVAFVTLQPHLFR